MKSTQLIATTAAVLLLPTLLFAQSPPPALPAPLPRVRSLNPGNSQGPSETLPDNYQLILTMTDKDGQPQELSLVSANTGFAATLGDEGFSFYGTIVADEDGTVRVNYTLTWSTGFVNNGSTNYKTTTIQSSAHLKTGQELVILHTNMHTAKLLVKKLE